MQPDNLFSGARPLCDSSQNVQMNDNDKTRPRRDPNVSLGELCSVGDVTLKQDTTDLMKVLEKEFGKKITTRTWNTVERIGKLLGG